MKAIILLRFVLLFLVFALTSFGDPYTVKRISDKDFRYEFYIINKKIEPKKNKSYYWFKGGHIHETQSGIAGDLLNDMFIKMYHSNQLAEQGKFKNGLRVGIWKTWHANGVLASSQTWHNGLRSGKFLRYDANSALVERGSFISDLKTGKWINLENQDTLTYKRGVLVPKKQTFSKSEKYRLKQENIKLQDRKKEQKELEAAEDAAKLAKHKAQVKQEQKAKNEAKKPTKLDVFYKSLFRKKDKTEKNNG